MIQYVLSLITLLLIQTLIDGFSVNTMITMVPSKMLSKRLSTKVVGYAKDGQEIDDLQVNEKKGFFGELLDVFKNLDDVAEDFFYKRMGKGEIFYGKRKYKPSGDVEGEYNGFGLSDKLKIDMTREYKEAWLEEKRLRDEMKLIKEEKERRDAAR